MDNRLKLNILGIRFAIKNPFGSVNNSIVLIKNGNEKKLAYVKGLKVKFYGSNNKIIFYDRIPKMKNVRIECGFNTKITVRETAYRIKNLYINARANNAEVNIGQDFSIESGKFDFHGEPNLKINIGNDCQFGCNVSIDTADGHTIYDNESGQMLNHPKHINIGNHVWLCENVSVLKGSNIADNSVIGKNCLVSGISQDTNQILAGCPARAIKSNINWSRKANKEYERICE